MKTADDTSNKFSQSREDSLNESRICPTLIEPADNAAAVATKVFFYCFAFLVWVLFLSSITMARVRGGFLCMKCHI